MAARRSMRLELAELLNSMESPVYVVDARRRIVFANEALAAMLGIEATELQGRECQYHWRESADDVTTLTDRLCPPPQALAGQCVETTVQLHAGERGDLTRCAYFLPLGSPDGSAAGVIGMISPDDAPEPTEPGRVRPRHWQGRDWPAMETAVKLHERIGSYCRRQRRQYHLSRLIGDSPAMRQVRAQIDAAVASRARTVVVGPFGSGREHIARSIHVTTSEEAAPLTPLSCDLLDGELLASTVEAFVRSLAELSTEQAGTLLLLEVDRLSAAAQEELMSILRVPELDLKILATARRSPMELAAGGNFHQELARELCTLVIRLLPLAERREDIPLLAQTFLEEENRIGSVSLGGFTDEAMDLLVAYDWPENADQLARTVREACHTAEGPLVKAEDLPERIAMALKAAAYPPRQEEPIHLDEFLAKVEAELFRRALARAKGNKSRAARMLGISRARLLRRWGQLHPDEDQ